MERLNDLLKEDRIIPSVSNLDQLRYAVEKRAFSCIMLKMGDINSIGKLSAYIHKYQKTVMLQLPLH